MAEAATKARIAEALAIIDGFSTRLAADWPALKALEGAASSLESSGLTAEADYLRSLASGGDAARTGGPSQGIDSVLAASGVVTELQRRLALRDSSIALAKESGDPVLAKFITWAGEGVPPSAAGAVDLAALENLSRSLSRIAEVAAPLQKFMKEQWGNTDTKLLAKRAAESEVVSAPVPSRESFLAWIELAKRSPKLDAALDPRRAGTAAELLQQSLASRKRLEEEFKATPEKRLTDLEAAARLFLDELTALPFDAQTQPRIAEGVTKVEAQLRELKQGLENAVAVEGAKRAGSAKEVREGLTAQQTIVTTSESINAAWRSGRDKLLAATPDKDYAQLRVSADALRTALLNLDAKIGPGLHASGADEIGRAVAAASWAERERVIAGVLKDWKGVSADPEGEALAASAEPAAAAFATRRAELTALERDAAAIRTQVSAGGSLTEKTPSGEPLASLVERFRRSGLLADTALAAAVRPLLQEVESLERVEALVGAKELVAAAEGALPNNWPMALAAWRRLGRLTSPAWPDSFEALERGSGRLGPPAGGDVRLDLAGLAGIGCQGPTRHPLGTRLRGADRSRRDRRGGRHGRGHGG